MGGCDKIDAGSFMEVVSEKIDVEMSFKLKNAY